MMTYKARWLQEKREKCQSLIRDCAMEEMKKAMEKVNSLQFDTFPGYEQKLLNIERKRVLRTVTRCLHQIRIGL